MLVTFDQALAIAQALGDPSLRFDVTKFNYIGNPARENNTVTAWHASGVKSVQDALERKVTVGSTGASTSTQYRSAMNALIGTKFKLVTGYPGGNDINLAMERGEVAVRGSNSWGVLEVDARRLAARRQDQHSRPDRPQARRLTCRMCRC